MMDWHDDTAHQASNLIVEPYRCRVWRTALGDWTAVVSRRGGAYYGPDATFASKVVVGILLTEHDDDVAVLRKWFADAMDVRLDPGINLQILALVEQYHVHRVAMVD